jgi:superfamily I DNA and RNA helicase
LFRTLQFDAIFIDEGQDLVPEEYRLLLKLVKADMQTNEKNLIIFYDDAQNLYGKPRPVWKDIGIDVQRGNRSRIMKECFRNTKEVVELGFNVMLGKQSHDSTAVTMRTYADVNMLRQHDLIEEYDDHFKVKFTKRSFSDPIVIRCSNRAEEKERVASEVINLIYDGQVRPEDILILFDRIAEYKDLDAIIKSKDKHGLIKGFIKPYGGNRDDMDRYIFQENHITLSTTKGAKGHDAYLVFLLGADLFSTDSEGRASFYVGATRSKLGLFITGVLAENNLLHEALKLGDMLK